MTFRESEELQPLVHAHHCPARPLAGGGYIDEARRWQLGIGKAPAVTADADRHQLAAAAEKRAAGAEISRLFHPDAVALVNQDARSEVERRLRAGHNDHLLGPAIDASCNAEIFGDSLAQLRMSGIVDIAENVFAATPGVAGEKPCPRGEGKGLALRETRMEI